MSRINTFTFRVNKHERRLISTLADRLQRSQSDAVRLLIREAARELAKQPRGNAQPNRVHEAPCDDRIPG